MKKIALIFSFNTNKTSQAARKIGDELGVDQVEFVNAETITEKEFLSYDKLILGVPTWFDGELPNYWDEFVPALEDLNLKGKTFAIFGNGNQKGYPENFVDGVGIMADLLESRGAQIVGMTPVKGYEFENSRALRSDKFAGLALDFENQASQINGKIKEWVKQIKKEFRQIIKSE
jgi:flavodoxin I